ncbi:Periplasmic [NiFe] hydrogenase small subunit precursor [uncultured Clostridium sp.]|uniref:hydrogenase small subunit n=1 Tax=uncultured Clostridium sp. TaxID=59620 RepID=UPI000823206E|nr:hydrogenase small subunit [uncultured Clostridium sp.]SCJ50958.1 Periplasmic [NiFe] hydrogenase small subunit precursor [uncultured Clostridium sp.]
MSNSCCENKTKIAIDMINKAIDDVEQKRVEKINAIWLETSGCFGEVISLLNSEDPNLPYMLEKFVNMKYFESIQGNQGEEAYKSIIESLDTEYILIVSGAIPTRNNGLYTTVATYNGEKITAMRAVTDIAKNAKYIINVGTCACFGGPTAAKPNVSEALSVSEFLKRNDIIKIPGCPANPVWVAGILGYITSRGIPKVDSNGRPLAYYSTLIHDRCPRRRFFDQGIFAEKFGDIECMFKLGCKGPVTYAYCPVSRWNQTYNWPIEDNTTCIGCAAPGFPDDYEPFVKYDLDNI